MNARRRLDPVNSVQVMPPRGISQSRLGHEHDQNDSINERLRWHQDFNDFLKAREDHAANKVVHKTLEDQQNKVKGVGHSIRVLLFWIAAIIILSPMVYSIEMAVIKRLFGG